MRIRYYPEHDMLHIALVPVPYDHSHGDDTNDPDITLLYDKSGRLAEIEIEHASKRLDLDEMRRRWSYEEVAPKRTEVAS